MIRNLLVPLMYILNWIKSNMSTIPVYLDSVQQPKDTYYSNKIGIYLIDVYVYATMPLTYTSIKY